MTYKNNIQANSNGLTIQYCASSQCILSVWFQMQVINMCFLFVWFPVQKQNTRDDQCTDGSERHHVSPGAVLSQQGRCCV